MLHLVIVIVGVYAATLGFALLINVSPKALNLGGVVAVAGYLVYLAYFTYIGGYVGANVVGAFSIGIFGMIAARYKKMPVIVFNTPALVPLVPGGQAYQVMKYVALNQPHMAFFYLTQVVMIAGSIAMGFLLAELFIQLFYYMKRRFNQKRSPS
ncbi:threonine/serine exporter family protein [Fructilactobacillus myrtifloralis]|uniref:Threonine/serine exporter family protein n=1 Tax=Fructilactobacillus myrtifloralis TaxID=2940301 RepID=A0ABY5BRI2_9LACO|nr:threonine/serine exporter family protein [Fructilactobacillus myrtifloralis]USS85673.1 threonine/serine exporter family protein [Fructilactobacillus myrtifloralis]